MYGRLPAKIRSFRRIHPEVRLVLREATTAAQIAALRGRELDIAVVIPPLGDDGGLQIEAFDADRLGIAVPIAHRLAERGPAKLSDLADEPFVLWPASEGRGFHDRVMRLCANAGFTPYIAQEANSMSGVLCLVAVETGVSIVPSSMATVRHAEVRFLPLKNDEAAFDLVVCTRAKDTTPAAKSLLSSLLDTG